MEDLERNPADLTDAIVRLGKLTLRFSSIDRATYWEDGVTRESDTDHTVMLGLIACAYASAHAPHLDVGKVAQFSLVHDLVEAYAGDTPTARALSSDEKAGKDAREHEAMERIRREFDTQLPWLGETLESYERLDTPEACFVKAIDKVLPKITHLLNRGKMLEDMGIGKEELESIHDAQHRTIGESYGKDQQEALMLYRSLSDLVKKELFP